MENFDVNQIIEFLQQLGTMGVAGTLIIGWFSEEWADR